jgi:hypothetical protein
MKLHPFNPTGFLMTIGLALAPACALAPPVQTSGTLAKSGVQVSVVGQRCTETVEPEWQGANLVEATVQVEVRNGAPAPLTVDRDQFHLRGADGRKVPTKGWSAREPLSVESGQTKTFKLDFLTRGGLSCTKQMQLDAESAVELGTAPLQLGSVTFVPSRA